MSDLRTAAKELLDALERGESFDRLEDVYAPALRAALADPEQKPVAWMYDFLNTDNREEVIRNWMTQDPSEIDREKGFNVRPLYTAPPQRKPLTVAETNALIDSVDGLGIGRHVMHKVARAIEQAHGIGETSA